MTHLPNGYLLDEFNRALAQATTMVASPAGELLPKITQADIAEVVRLRADVNIGTLSWKTPASVGTEISMAAVVKLKDGRWAALEEWNQDTDLGCDGGSDVHVGASEEQVVRFGLTAEASWWLGYPEEVP